MPKLFADLASMQPSNLEYFKWLKQNGVSKAVVKLTEDTGYVNPSASAQFMNGLKVFGEVGLYHFLHNKPIREARYFVAQAEAMHVDKDTLMIVDVESSDVKSTKQNVTQNVNDWLDVVYESGFHNLAVYASESWFNSVLSINYLHHGAKTWVAGYGRKPQVARMDAWQYTDSFKGRTQDISYDYGMFNSKPKSNYYSDGSLFEMLGDRSVYNSLHLVDSEKRRVRLTKGSRIYAKPVKNGKIWTLKSKIGYISANKKFVKKIEY